MSLADTIGFFIALVASALFLVAFINEAFWFIRKRFNKLRAECTLRSFSTPVTRPHAYVDASQNDIYCCDLCGRPHDNPIHKI